MILKVIGNLWAKTTFNFKRAIPISVMPYSGSNHCGHYQLCKDKVPVRVSKDSIIYSIDNSEAFYKEKLVDVWDVVVFYIVARGVC